MHLPCGAVYAGERVPPDECPCNGEPIWRSLGNELTRKKEEEATYAWWERRDAMRAFKEAAGKRCVMCGTDQNMTAHHVISKQRLKQLGVDVWTRYDPRDAMGLCLQCHFNHESYAKRVPFSKLKPCHFEFERELGLDGYLERYYPQK